MNLTDWEQAQVLAQKWAQEGDTAVKVDLPAPTPKAGSISLEQAWEGFLAQAKARKLSPATIYKYSLLRRQMLGFAHRHGFLLVKELDVDSLEAFRAEWSEGALSCLKKLERLKAFFRMALLRRWIDDNPAVTLRGPKVRPRPTEPFTREEMANILSALRRYPDKSGRTGRANAMRLRAFVLLLRYSGMRIGDVTSLSTDRIAGNKIFLYTQKTGVPVYCVLPEFAVEALREAPKLSDTYFFWTGNSTLHTAVGSWQRSLRRLFKLASVAHGHGHRFRDTFAVELLLAGVGTEEVAALLGHSSIKVTQEHYSPWVRDRQRKLEEDLERAWNRDPIVLLEARVTQKLRSQGSGLPN